MRKIMILFVVIFLIPAAASAHSLILSVIDNDDDTITIVGNFDTGALAEGAMVRLESDISGKVLFQKRLPQESELTVAIPKEPYKIILDGGPGHVSEKTGIPPRDGFSAKPREKARKIKTGDWGIARVVTTGAAFFLLFITIYLSRKNTAKLIESISKSI